MCAFASVLRERSPVHEELDRARRKTANATNGNHTIRVNGDAGAVKVSGLPATVDVLHPEFANDRLEINTPGAGNEVDAGGLAAGAIQFHVNGV